MHARGSSFFAAVASLSALPAQPPALAPTVNTTIATGGSLHYSSILIPAGVTVQFTGTAPAVVTCDGDCIVHGTLSAAAIGATDGPGAVTQGMGSPGAFCAGYCSPFFGCSCSGFSFASGPGVHHGVYGAAIPFSLSGGSPGGSSLWYTSSNPLFSICCDVFLQLLPGGGGGGTLIVDAGGVVDIHGVVDVRGGTFASPGSAGSLLLRGAGGTTLRPGGQLLAGPASASGGEVRLDAWGGPPLVQGTIVAPAPAVLELPHLHTSAAPVIGTTWSIDVLAPAGAIVFVAASTQQGVSTPTPFGKLQIDLSTAVIVGAAAPAPGHDPQATIPWAIPNLPHIIGVQVWMQGLAWPPTLPPRLTNAISAAVQ